MNYLDESLSNISGLSIHWSSDCNMACKYCYIEKHKKAMADFNAGLRQALEDGSFIKIIKEKFNNETTINRIEALSLWGAEPTLNAKYFNNFIIEILNYFPNISHFMFSTNALLGGKCLYDNFVLPLYNYCIEHKRKIKFELQFSLDGPKEFNDDSRHPGATDTTLNAIKHILEMAPIESEYLELRIITKATLDIHYMRIMNTRGIEAFNWYYQFFDYVQGEAVKVRKNKEWIKLDLNTSPTLVDPGFYTQSDGKEFAAWLHQLQYIDRSQLPTYEGQPLIYQIMSGIDSMIDYTDIRLNPLSQEIEAFSCSASKNNITIDHLGNIYTCNRLCKNISLSEADITKAAMTANTNINSTDKKWLRKTWGSFAYHADLMSRYYMLNIMVCTLAAAGQIDKKYLHDEQLRIVLFYMLTHLICQIGIEEDLTSSPNLINTGLVRLFCNGAVEEIIHYAKLEQKRGNMKAWKFAM